MDSTIRPPGGALHVVLLDIDGTLIDSNDAHARAWVAALAVHGYVVRFEQVRPLIGMGGDHLLPILTGLEGKGPDAERIGKTRGEEFRKLLPGLKPTTGARELLVHLRDAGLELVVATSAKEDEVTAILAQAMLADLIQAAASSDDANASKPAPDIIRAALSKAGRPAHQAIMLGDTPYDIEAATRARVPSIVFRCGGGWPDDALRGAIAIYDDPAHLVSAFGESAIGTGLVR